MTQVQCRCGKVRLGLSGAPINSAECCCESCRAAAARLQLLPGAPDYLTKYQATAFVLYRKDRVRFLQGDGRLAEFRLSPKAGTRRVVATCCNTPVFLEFAGGHWLSLYGHLWPADARPRPDFRTMASDLADPSGLPDDVPNYSRQPVSFFVRLFSAWAAMGFRNPKIEVRRVIDA